MCVFVCVCTCACVCVCACVHVFVCAFVRSVVKWQVFTINFLVTSPPQSHLGTVRCYPHIGECTLPLCVLAVVWTMRNEVLRSIMGRYGSIIGRYGMLRKCCTLLQDVTECYGTLRALKDVTERCRSVLGCCREFWNIMEHCVTLRDIAERYGKYCLCPSLIEF